MSEKQFEECSLLEATHVEVNGKVHEIGDKLITTGFFCGEYMGLRWLEEDAFLPIEMFSILGIKPLREKKREPIEFEAVMGMHDGQWHTLAILNDNFAYLNNKKVRFKCVEILEED